MQPTPIAVKFSADNFAVELSDGRTLCVPYSVSAKLMAVTREQREQVRLSPSGLHWDQIDEDLGIAGLLRECDEQLVRRRLQSVPRAVKVDPDDL